MDEETYKAGDVLTVQVRVKEVILTSDGPIYRVVPRDNEYALMLEVPKEDVINKVID